MKVTENRIGSALVLETPETEAYIVYPGDKKEELETNKDIFKWEKVIVKEWSVSISTLNNNRFNINKLWEFKLNEDGSFAVFSSDVWVKSNQPTDIKLRYASANVSADSVVSITQNEVGSTLYVLQWSAEISNLGWQSTLLWKWQKITISRGDASNEDLDLSALKTSLDSFFQWSEWFIRNNGAAYLNSETTDTGTGTTVMAKSNEGSLLIYSGIQDESTITTDSITLEWTFQSDGVKIIRANNITASIDEEAQTFRIENIPTEKQENDIIIKVYNGSRELLDKDIITVYYTWGEAATDALFKVENYSLDATEFQFISPKKNPYTTDAWVVMVEGRVPVGIVKTITVNDYTLQKFPQYGTYWTYFANQEFGNLKEGLNIYNVKYIDQNGDLLHSNAFTIIQEKPKPEAIISDEADPVS